jgi:hypothetical protein
MLHRAEFIYWGELMSRIITRLLGRTDDDVEEDGSLMRSKPLIWFLIVSGYFLLIYCFGFAVATVLMLAVAMPLIILYEQTRRKRSTQDPK